jgi:hypothetical protein
VPLVRLESEYCPVPFLATEDLLGELRRVSFASEEKLKQVHACVVDTIV